MTRKKTPQSSQSNKHASEGRPNKATLALMERAEQLHRSSQALLALVQKAAPSLARVAVISPKLGGKPAPEYLLQTSPEQVPDEVDWWPRAGLPERPLVAPPGHGALSLANQDCTVVACDVLGLRGADLDFAMARISEDQRQGSRIRPIIITDAPEFSAMTQRGYVVEYMPHGEGLTDQRRVFVERKWGVDRWDDLRDLRAPIVQMAQAVAQSSSAAMVTTRRKRAAVIAWDLGHNPVGRAVVLYDLLSRDWDVEIIGPIWKRFGGKIWGPITDSGRKVRGFACETMEDYWPSALALASDANYDLVVVSKPRLPSLLLGALIKDRCGCPMVIDVDDFELSFFTDETSLTLDELDAAGPDAMRHPYDEIATRAADALVRDADAVVVSNVALRNRFGGMVVRHARDEIAFHPDRFDRATARAEMGIAADDFALIFVGTARAHKGVFDIARTLAALSDKRFVLHLVGTITDLRIRKELESHRGARIVYHPDCPFEDLPRKIAAADAVVLLQDPSHPVSQFQIPAKVSDASAFGLPILVTDVPPLRDLALQGLVQVIDPADLGSKLIALWQDRESGRARHSRLSVREAFEQELGFDVNRARLALAITRARTAAPKLSESFRHLIDIAGRAHAALAASSRPIDSFLPASLQDGAFDLVMFWKQNDSGIYGRRSDMLMKYLLRSGRVRRVLQLDAPMDVQDLARLTDPSRGAASGQVLANTIANQFARRDTDTHQFRTFLWDRTGKRAVLPDVGKSISDYPDWVLAQMAAAGIAPEKAFAWVCPVVFDFPAVAARIPFRGIIGDIIDDQRNFDMSPRYHERIVASYAETLPLFDLTITNCAPVAAAFSGEGREIRIVPNGTELFASEVNGKVCAHIASLTGPVVGYVGNLRDRIDWDLLHECALAMPEVTFVIVGGGARAGATETLERLKNVLFTGPVSYDQALTCMTLFDVALVPHLRNALTASMNPLKIYNYFAAKVPIVSTEVENVDDALRPWLRFAGDSESFAVAIRDALEAPRLGGPDYDAVLGGITWESRVADILHAIDTWQCRA